MTSFQDRERAFEAKYAHDEEFRFLLTARRDKLFAHEAGNLLGLPEAEAEALTTAVLGLRDGPDHDGLLIRYVADVFAAHRRSDAADGLSASLHACETKARQQLLAMHDPD